MMMSRHARPDGCVCGRAVAGPFRYSTVGSTINGWSGARPTGSRRLIGSVSFPIRRTTTFEGKDPGPVRHIASKDAAELDAIETREWLDSLDYVLQSGGPAKVARLLRELTIHARQNGVKLPFTANTPYINTISADEQSLMPGSPDLERRIKSLVRWNAAAMVVRANKASEGIGGHISTFASAATLYEVGFNHFFRGHESGDPDVIFFQGHAAPGIYARAYLDGRID